MTITIYPTPAAYTANTEKCKHQQHKPEQVGLLLLDLPLLLLPHRLWLA